MASGSPPGITGPFQPCGSPRKNWTASAPRAVASASGSSTWKWAPMRGMHRAYYPTNPPLDRPMASPTNPAMMPVTMTTRWLRVEETIWA